MWDCEGLMDRAMNAMVGRYKDRRWGAHGIAVWGHQVWHIRLQWNGRIRLVSKMALSPR